LGDVRQIVFRSRGYIPVPFAALLLALARTNLLSFVSGLLIAAFGEGIRIWALSYTGMGTRTRKVGAERLVTDGPYAYIRNPLYLGNLFLGLGFCVAAWAWMPWMIPVFLAGFSLQYALIVSLEEETLRKIFGRTYEDYAVHVPRFLPRFSPYGGSREIAPDLRKALRSERDTFFTIAICMILIAIRWYIR